MVLISNSTTESRLGKNLHWLSKSFIKSLLWVCVSVSGPFKYFGKDLEPQVLSQNDYDVVTNEFNLDDRTSDKGSSIFQGSHDGNKTPIGMTHASAEINMVETVITDTCYRNPHQNSIKGSLTKLPVIEKTTEYGPNIQINRCPSSQPTTKDNNRHTKSIHSSNSKPESVVDVFDTKVGEISCIYNKPLQGSRFILSSLSSDVKKNDLMHMSSSSTAKAPSLEENDKVNTTPKDDINYNAKTLVSNVQPHTILPENSRPHQPESLDNFSRIDKRYGQCVEPRGMTNKDTETNPTIITTNETMTQTTIDAETLSHLRRPCVCSQKTMTEIYTHDACTATHGVPSKLTRHCGTITSGPFMKKLRRAQKVFKKTQATTTQEMKEATARSHRILSNYHHKMERLVHLLSRKDQMLGSTSSRIVVVQGEVKEASLALRSTTERLNTQCKINAALMDVIESKSENPSYTTLPHELESLLGEPKLHYIAT